MNPDDIEWVTERARELIASGLDKDAAVAKAVEDGEARARRRRAEEWQKTHQVEDALDALDKQRRKRDQEDGQGNSLRASLFDLTKKKPR